MYKKDIWPKLSKFNKKYNKLRKKQILNKFQIDFTLMAPVADKGAA